MKNKALEQELERAHESQRSLVISAARSQQRRQSLQQQRQQGLENRLQLRASSYVVDSQLPCPVTEQPIGFKFPKLWSPLQGSDPRDGIQFKDGERSQHTRPVDSGSREVRVVLSADKMNEMGSCNDDEVQGSQDFVNLTIQTCVETESLRSKQNMERAVMSTPSAFSTPIPPSTLAPHTPTNCHDTTLMSNKLQSAKCSKEEVNPSMDNLLAGSCSIDNKRYPVSGTVDTDLTLHCSTTSDFSGLFA